MGLLFLHSTEIHMREVIMFVMVNIIFTNFAIMFGAWMLSVNAVCENKSTDYRAMSHSEWDRRMALC